MTLTIGAHTGTPRYLEALADDLIMGAIQNRYPTEAEEEGDHLLNELFRLDPPALVKLTPIVITKDRREVEASILSTGDRVLWWESTNNPLDRPAWLAPAALYELRDRALKLKHSKKSSYSYPLKGDS